MSSTSVVVSKRSRQVSLLRNVNGERRVDSRDIAQGINIQHKALMETIRKYQGRLERRGILPFETAEINGRGQPEKFALLNYRQATFLMTLSRNTDAVVDFKDRLTEEFDRLMRQAERRACAEWQQARLEGKDARRHETDTIKAFVDYATAQGSSNAARYYCNLTKMTRCAASPAVQGGEG